MPDKAPLQADRFRIGVPEGDGWFVLNARQARWLTGDFGAYTRFEGETRFPHLGFNIGVLQPGQPACYYHAEDEQEDFLVLSGECLLLIEGEERQLRLGLRALPAVDRARLRRRRGRAVRGAGGRHPTAPTRSCIRSRSSRSATAPASAAGRGAPPRHTPTSPTTRHPVSRRAGCRTSDRTARPPDPPGHRSQELGLSPSRRRAAASRAPPGAPAPPPGPTSPPRRARARRGCRSRARTPPTAARSARRG